MAMTLLKQSGEWVTSWWDKYRTDPFFRTTTRIVVVQVAFAAALIGAFWLTLQMLEAGLLATIIYTFDTILRGTDALTAEELLAQLSEETHAMALLAAGVITAFTIVASSIITVVALAPTRRALAQQRRFLSNIAHELRTPLAVLRTSTEVALLAEKLPAETREALETHLEELSRISEIINNLLSLSNSLRIDPISFEAVDLGEVASRAMALLAPLAKRKAVTVTLHERMGAVANGNLTALEQVALNVLKNAITWSSRGGAVEITVGPSAAGMVEMTVADHGVGIPKKDLAHVFEPFYRGEASRNREYGRSGLGLTIAHEIITAHHGTIALQSKQNRGTTVVLSIPRVKTAPSPQWAEAGVYS